MLFSKKAKKQTVWLAYMSGHILPIEEVQDDVFAKKMMGDGIAIRPYDAKVYAPFNGIVKVIAPTKHAIALESDDGVQILIHIGLDSTLYSQDACDVLVAVDEVVRQGQAILTVNEQYFKTKDFIVPMVILQCPKQCKYEFYNLHKEVIAKESVIVVYA